MRNPMLVVLCLLAVSFAMAQTKIDTKWTCAKPAENPKFDAGDAPGHSYGLAKGACDATSGNSGEKSGAYAEIQEEWKNSMKTHGTFDVTMDNGDMVYYTYDITGSLDMKKPLMNKWKIVNGTGKHKGAKGMGSCSGTMNADQSSSWVCTGSVTMGGMAKEKAKE
jgi:hypothetical protein